MIIYGVDYGGGNCSPSISYCNTVFQRVDDLPSLGDATRNHAYITPDNNIYILNADGTGYMQMSASGGSVTVGLSSKEGSITIVETNDGATRAFDIKVSEDIINRITALENKQDKDTIYDDSVLETKINDILDRITNLGGTYTAGNGLVLSDNEFSIDDTKVATQQELEETNTRLTTVEEKNVEQENRITSLENKEQGTGQAIQLYTVINGHMSDNIDDVPNFSIFTDIPNTKTIEITIHTAKGTDSALISHGVILENNLKRFTLNKHNNNYEFDGVWGSNKVYMGDVTVFVRIYEIQPVEHYNPYIYIKKSVRLELSYET